MSTNKGNDYSMNMQSAAVCERGMQAELCCAKSGLKVDYVIC